ncbi:MAG: ABC transporter permease [Acidobacteria bacterium]|nr:ABC transporter permease [Acidobacteriota bacterium]
MGVGPGVGGVSGRDLAAYAGRALAGHRLRSVLSLLGVAVGIAAVVLLTALGEGARRYVVDQFAQIGSSFVAVVPGKTDTTGAIPGLGGVPNDLTLDDAQALRRALPYVNYVAPFVVATDEVAFGERRRQVLVAGVTPEFVQLRRLNVARGRFLPETELDRGAAVAVLGHKVATELFGGADPIGEAVRIGGRRCKVIGVLASRGQQLGMNMDDVALVPVATGMRMFNRTSLFRIVIDVGDEGDLEAVKQRALAVLIERHGEEDVTLITEAAVVDSLSAILDALTLAVAAIAAISLAVAGIGILNVLLVAVSERTAEIGLLRAVGASRRQVLTCFLAEAILLSALGGALGLAAGALGVHVLVGIFPALPASPPAWAIAAAVALSLSVGGVFGWLPARRAANLDPVLALSGR